jgi:FMN phosphatase YigB (HAD superfamily)
MLKTIIFDFGNVLVSDTVKKFRHKFKFLPPVEKNHKKYEAILVLTETGKAPTRKLLEFMQKTMAPSMTVQSIQNFMVNNKILQPWKLAEKLSKHYQIIIFSNNQKYWPEKTTKKLKTGFLRFPFVDSAKVGLRKPDPEFYKYLITKYQLTPKECIFIDDHKRNLIPAKKLGMRTYCYDQDYPKLIKYLRRLNIKIS